MVVMFDVSRSAVPDVREEAKSARLRRRKPDISRATSASIS